MRCCNLSQVYKQEAQVKFHLWLTPKYVLSSYYISRWPLYTATLLSIFKTPPPTALPGMKQSGIFSPRKSLIFFTESFDSFKFFY